MESAVSYTVNLFGLTFELAQSVLIQWIVIGIALILAILYSRKLSVAKPSKVQSAVELVVEFIAKLVNENMGEGTSSFIPYIGSLGAYLLLLNFIGLFGIKAPTSDFSVDLGIAIISFFVIQGNTIKKHGFFSYLKGYGVPVAVLLPINIMERIMLPISLSLRLYGNIFAATIIMELLYSALGSLSTITMLGIPIPFHFYFDVFDGTIQMVIFVMLTMINTKVVCDHSDFSHEH